MRQNATLWSVLLLVAANSLIPLAILVFATGFFPYKPFLPGLAQHGDFSEYGPAPPAPFDRLVFMVVDALRSDFVYLAGSGFEHTQSLIRDGVAVPFTAHATSPTVTMPRLKAITTGSIPSFLDVILNLDEGDETSTLASQDTWLAQMKAKGTGKLAMYGDDTWLKLFPDIFDRADGTTSFFVSDFTEVDHNVTRHIAEELRRDDWNTMVLHYLGLDHIGHKGGPRSSNMLPKQREMDGIVQQIFEAIESEDHLQSTLFVVCGDHGMNDAGNHGASSPGETSAALVFLSPLFGALQKGLESPLPWEESFQYYSAVEQSDIAPTLAFLLGFPIPKNNLGAFITEFLPFWPKQVDKTRILMRNARQMLGIISASFGSHLFELDGISCTGEEESDVAELACEWRSIAGAAERANPEDIDDPQWVSMASEWLRKAQRLMSSMASNYDMSRLLSGQVIAAIAVISSVLATCFSLGEGIDSSLPVMSIAAAYGAMMFASSYVEEEHHFWYWASSAWLAILGLKSFKGERSNGKRLFSLSCAFVATRLIRGWNQTGQKLAGEPDIVKTYINPHPMLLWTLVGAAYLMVSGQLVRGFRGLPTVVRLVSAAALTSAAFTFKLAFTNEDAPELVAGPAKTLVDLLPQASLVARARLVFAGLGLATSYVLYHAFSKGKNTGLARSPATAETLRALYTLLAMTQSRATNIPLFLLFSLQARFLDSLGSRLGAAEVSTSTLLLSSASFFACGGSNAISSVDLSSAYNGVAAFNVTAVGVLTFVGNWAAPIYWVFVANELLGVTRQKKGQRYGDGLPSPFLRHATLLTVFSAVSVASVMAACTALRTHLFIWTVFSPKYLYCMAWALGQHLAVQLGLGGVLWLASR